MARTAHAQERNGLGLAHDGQARVVAPRVALPVRVVGNVARGESDGVGIRQRVQLARRRVAVVRVQGDAVGAVGVDGEGAADAVPDADGLDGVFLGSWEREVLVVTTQGGDNWAGGHVGT